MWEGRGPICWMGPRLTFAQDSKEAKAKKVVQWIKGYGYGYLHKTEHFLQRKWKKVSQGCCIAAGRRPQRRKLFRAHRCCWLAINGDLESVTASIFLFPRFLKCLGVMFLALCLCFYFLLSPWVCWTAMKFFFVCVFVLSVFFHLHNIVILSIFLCINLHICVSTFLFNWCLSFSCAIPFLLHKSDSTHHLCVVKQI